MSAVSFIISKQLLPQSIPYYCMRCKTHLFNINGDTLVMWMGEGYPPREIPLDMLWIAHRCRGCKKDYNIYFQA